MSFLETLGLARAQLEQHRRISLRAMRREFGLDAEILSELLDELVQVQRVAVMDGDVVVWAGDADAIAPAEDSRRDLAIPQAAARVPRAYTPKHLADRILERFFAILAEGVHRFEGTVNQYTGDGIMALFGAPIAHEDHAQRACYAALALRDALRAYGDELRVTHGLNFGFRIGMNSGEVVVGRIGDDLRMDYTAQGHTVGLAQRMEALADSRSIVLSANTAHFVDGYFALRDLGPTHIKGVAEALHVFELEGIGTRRTRLDASRAWFVALRGSRR